MSAFSAIVLAAGHRLQVVDGLADQPGGPYLKEVRQQDGDAAQNQGDPVASQIRKQMSQRSYGDAPSGRS